LEQELAIPPVPDRPLPSVDHADPPAELRGRQWYEDWPLWTILAVGLSVVAGGVALGVFIYEEQETAPVAIGGVFP